MPTETLDLADIQGLIVRGYGDQTAACYLLLQIADPAAARGWLGSLADAVTTAAQKGGDTSLNVAFTSAGLARLGLPDTALAGFSGEFNGGMVTPHRSRILGDTDESAPEHWAWGGPDNPSIDLLLLLFATDQPTLEKLYGGYADGFAANGITELLRLDTTDLGGNEHFGFRDGISQPTIEGLAREDTAANTVRAGEFILGYKNEYNLFTDPLPLDAAADPKGLLAAGDVSDLSRNGTYLVFRQLRQDVAGFWSVLDKLTQHPDGTSDPYERTKLASKMVGRWPSGAPMTLTPDKDDPALATANDFAYFKDDQYGFGCPIGAHIRRANPRDTLDPKPGSAKSVAVGKRHRLLRRGREYGPPFVAGEPGSAEQERGLQFICLNGNIARQFEFLQHTWINNHKFDGLYDDADPLLAPHAPYGGTFTVPAEPVRERYRGLPRFVSVRGGAYFFLPGLRAIRYLSSLGG
jgi:Dyp-type peroxidase family